VRCRITPHTSHLSAATALAGGWLAHSVLPRAKAESKWPGGCFYDNLRLRAVASHPVAARRAPASVSTPQSPRRSGPLEFPPAQSGRHEKPRLEEASPISVLMFGGARLSVGASRARPRLCHSILWSRGSAATPGTSPPKQRRHADAMRGRKTARPRRIASAIGCAAYPQPL
jgi:hypothetical protein